MKKINKAIIIFLILSAGLGAVVYFWNGSLFRVGETVKIGVILPLTGNSADIGESLKNTLELAKANLKTKKDYEFLFEDMGDFDSIKAVLAMNKLVSVDRVRAVLTLSSGVGNAVAPIANQNKIVAFVCASDQKIAQGNYVFLNATPPSSEIKTLVFELKARGHKRLGLFNMNQEGIAAIVAELKKQIQGTDIQIVTEQKFDPKTTDFRSMITASKKVNPDIYLLNLLPPGLDNLKRQLKELKVDVPITSVEMIEYSANLDNFEGDWYVQAADAAPWFEEKYRDAFKEDPNICAPNLYDSFNFVVAANEKASSQGGVIEELLKIQNHEGALGIVGMGSNHVVNSNAVVRMIKNGKPVTVSR